MCHGNPLWCRRHWRHENLHLQHIAQDIDPAMTFPPLHPFASMGFLEAAANICGTPALWKPGDVRVEAVIFYLWMMASYDLPDLVNTLFRYVQHQ
jgi:hypothetical protein